jgi:hypothetical protein
MEEADGPARKREGTITDSSMEQGPGVEPRRSTGSSDPEAVRKRRGPMRRREGRSLREAFIVFGQRAIVGGKGCIRAPGRPPSPHSHVTVSAVSRVKMRSTRSARLLREVLVGSRRREATLSRGRSPNRRNPGNSRAHREVCGGEVPGPERPRQGRARRPARRRCCRQLATALRSGTGPVDDHGIMISAHALRGATPHER